MTYGITGTGLTRPNLDQQKADTKARLLTNVDPGLDVSDEAPIGQIVSIEADSQIELWEALEAVYSCIDPNKAEGVQLDNVCALSGVVRLKQRKSQVSVNLNLNAAVTVPAGSVLSVSGSPSIKFQLLADVTSVGAGVYPGTFECLDYGPVHANATTLTVIVTPVTGWNSATNPKDATLGRFVETDAELRLRREQELQQRGSSSADAIRAALYDVPGVIQALVYENSTMATDSKGLPPKSFEAVVWDGSVPQALDANLEQAVFDNKPAGIESYGSTLSKTFVDDSGNNILIEVTRATQLTIYIDATITTDANFDPINGPAAVKQALVDVGNALLIDGDVVLLKVRASAFNVPGVTDVPVFQAGTTIVTGVLNIPVGAHEIARFDTSRVNLTVT